MTPQATPPQDPANEVSSPPSKRGPRVGIRGVVLAISMPAPPTQIVPLGWFGLDPLTTLVVAGGRVADTGDWRHSIPIPQRSDLPGTPLVLQALSGTRLTLPATVVLSAQ